MFGKMKDVALSVGAKKAINSQIKEYGEMLKLNLDSNNKSLEAEVMLEGEKEPLTVKIARYEMREEKGKHFLKINGVTTSRAWINTVATTYLEGKDFEISAEYASIIKALI